MRFIIQLDPGCGNGPVCKGLLRFDEKRWQPSANKLFPGGIRMRNTTRYLMAAATLTLVAAAASGQQAPAVRPPPTPPAPLPLMPPSLPPNVVADLMTSRDAAALGVQWKVMDAKIVEVPAVQGAPAQYKTTYDIAPHAGETGFDDSSWPQVKAEELATRRGGGHVSFTWYRTGITIPAKIGDFDTTGTKVVLTVLVDDYGEVWLNGEMPRRAGFPSPATIQGFNMPNRVMLSESVKPGDKFQIAVFGINGPISVSPSNMVWFREARLEFYK